MRYNKYGNKKSVLDDIDFDSLKEARRYKELVLLLKNGTISDLELQKPYELIPAQYKLVKTGDVYKKGVKKGQPKMKAVCVERSVNYCADFVYKENGKTVVEDAKGVRTKEYMIKRKLMLFVHGIRIKEI